MSQSRSHLVLVPGFAGFDILGSVSYYYGVTEVLRRAAAGRIGPPLGALLREPAHGERGHARAWAPSLARGSLQEGGVLRGRGH